MQRPDLRFSVGYKTTFDQSTEKECESADCTRSAREGYHQESGCYQDTEHLGVGVDVAVKVLHGGEGLVGALHADQLPLRLGVDGQCRPVSHHTTHRQVLHDAHGCTQT